MKPLNLMTLFDDINNESTFDLEAFRGAYCIGGVDLSITTDLTCAHVIRYNGVLYDITRIDTFEGYKEDVTLYCSRRANQK